MECPEIYGGPCMQCRYRIISNLKMCLYVWTETKTDWEGLMSPTPAWGLTRDVRRAPEHVRGFETEPRQYVGT